MTITHITNGLTASSSTQRWRRCTSLAAAVLFGVICCSPMVAQAKKEGQTSQGMPGRRVSGASRLPSSACAAGPLVALVPENNLGATAVAEPTFWLSMPDITQEKQLEFYLFNAQEEILYQTDLTVGPRANLVGLNLATMADAPRLEVDQRYRWAASIACNPNNQSETIYVEGWIDRVEASTTNAQGLWYDHLGLVLEQIQRHPQNHEALGQWHRLMTSARLDQVVPLSLDAHSVEITSPTAKVSQSSGTTDVAH